MDKSSFSQWGGVVCIVIVLAILMGLATPFGNFITAGVNSSLSSFKGISNSAMGGGSGGSGGGEEPDDSATINEYGFYYDRPYSINDGYFVFKKDGSAELYMVTDGLNIPFNLYVVEAGMLESLQMTATYSNKAITVVAVTVSNGSANESSLSFTVSEDGLSLTDSSGNVYVLSGEYHDVYYDTMYYSHDSSFPNLTIHKDGSVKSSDGTMDLSAGALSFESHLITANKGTGDEYRILVSMDGKYLYRVINGTFYTFSIEKPSLAPGLYETGTENLKTSWADLLSAGTVKVSNGVVTSGFNTSTLQNDSAAALAGDLVLPSDGTVTKLGTFAFMMCTDLTGITIPEGVTTIERAALAGVGVTKLNIPKSVTSISVAALAANVNLTELTVTEGNSVYHSAGNCVIETATKTLAVGCKTSVIPTNGSVTTIGEGAFTEQPIESISIPDAVTKIETAAFQNCMLLKTVTLTDNVAEIGERAFSGCFKLESITLPANITEIKAGTFGGCDTLTTISIPKSVTAIGSEAITSNALTTINYEGSTTKWGAITLGTNWYGASPVTKVVCSDGEVALN